MMNSADPNQFAEKPTDLDLQGLQRQGISRFSRTRVNHTHSILVCHKYSEGCIILFLLVYIVLVDIRSKFLRHYMMKVS